MTGDLKTKIARRIHQYENQKRVAFSKKYPFLRDPIVFFRQLVRDIANSLDFRLRYKRQTDFFDCVVARHQSVLRRKLGDSDPRLQEQKVVNLRQAVQRLNGVVIEPNHIFSLWRIVGKPKYENGYVDGMLLANGEIVEGVGGGLCQLSNLLYWLFLHAPTQTVERYHHAMDVFPDSGRVLPFGSGATIMYNYIDLRVKNTSPHPLQLKLWLTDTHLKGQVLSPRPVPQKFHVFEKNHCYIRRNGQYFRYNEIYRETKIEGKAGKVEEIATNFAPVLYKITDEYLQENHFRVLDLARDDTLFDTRTRI
ncbi:MAG: VanW family protein [Anaerolineae bacterium]|nr:VanW family protein [Anaerolineae bacterium]